MTDKKFNLIETLSGLPYNEQIILVSLSKAMINQMRSIKGKDAKILFLAAKMAQVFVEIEKGRSKDTERL